MFTYSSKNKRGSSLDEEEGDQEDIAQANELKM